MEGFKEIWDKRKGPLLSGSSTLSFSLPRPETGWMRLKKLPDFCQLSLGWRWTTRVRGQQGTPAVERPLGQAWAGASTAIFSFTLYMRLHVLEGTLAPSADEKAK